MSLAAAIIEACFNEARALSAGKPVSYASSVSLAPCFNEARALSAGKRER